MLRYDRIIIGAGLYGLYAGLRCARNGEHVAVLEREAYPFARATYVNQARVHMGYHYPRSLSTAMKVAEYFERFVRDYGFCIKGDFDQVSATSSRFSWTDAVEFRRFCRAAGIRCDAVPPSRYFRSGMCDGAFLTTEYAYDAKVLATYFEDQVDECSNLDVLCNREVREIGASGKDWEIAAGDETFCAPKVLNATYAAANSVHAMVGAKPFPVKYELCEIILCDTSPKLAYVGITVMDGPFFSIMPFGNTGAHSLTSVTFTPHMTSRDDLPTFSCQANVGCCPKSLANCNLCAARPESAWPYMSQLARKYLLDDYGFSYRGSLFSMKPVLRTSEVDDSRPTVIWRVSETPEMVSVLSGKISTIYDLDPYLDGER